MIKNLDYYRSIHNATGCKTRKEMEVHQIHKRLDRDFEKTLDISEFSKFQSDEKIRLEIKKETRSDLSGYRKEFTSLITAPIKHGDTFLDELTKIYWICVESMCKSGLYYEGKLVRCNTYLKWQNDNGEVLEYPVFDYVGDSSDITDKTVVNVGEGKHKLLITADKNTIKLKHDMRFFLDRDIENPTVYRITRNDNTSGFFDTGVVTLTIEEDQYNKDTDNIEQWLCDYKKTSTDILPIQFNGDAYIRIGRSRTLWIDTDKSVVWKYPDISGISYDEKGTSLKVICSLDEELIGKKICIEAIVDSAKSECEFEIVGGV